MKLTKFLASCLTFSAIIIAGCTEEQIEPTVPEENTPVKVPEGEYELTASIGDVTKTVLSNVNLSWEKNDVIKIWTGAEFTDYTTAEGDGRFTGDKKAALNGETYVGLYPSATVTGTKATFTIPQEQTFAVRSANDLPMVAVWEEGGKCTFNPVCSIIEMPLFVDEGIELSSIAYDFAGNVGAGAYTYDWATDTYGSSVSGDITLTGEFAANAETPTYVYNAVIPGDYSGGFTLTLTDTDNCAMVLTATKGGELAAGKIQPLGDVRYKQLAPEYVISYDDWAATATLKTTLEGTGSYRYYLSKEVNGEPLDGLAPVEITNKTAGSTVKLYGYLCSENVAATGVKDGDKLYFVTKYYEGKKEYSRSVEYTYHPDPLEVVFYDDALNTSAKYTTKLAGWGSDKVDNWSEDKAFGEYCIKASMPKAYAELRLDIWDNELSTLVNLQPQAMALYHMEFYVKADANIKGNTYTAIRYNVGSTTGIMSNYQSAWQNFTHLPDETPIPANTWIKVSIPMNQIWLKTKITTTNYQNVDVNEYQGYTDVGGRDGWLYSYKAVDRIYINAQQDSYASDKNPTVFLIDHFTIRKSTL